jgi:hypothetical protein
MEREREERTRRLNSGSRRVYVSKSRRIIAISATSAISLIAMAAVGLSLSQASRLVKLVDEGRKAVLKRASGMMRLENVDIVEIGSTNLSNHVDKKLLLDVSGLRTGDELLKVELAEVEKRLMAVPWVESVQIQKKLPSTIQVRYTAHQARALGLRKNKLWLLSAEGKWIVPVGMMQFPLDGDLPVLISEETIGNELEWLDILDKELAPELLQIHEINDAGERGSHKVTALIEVQFSAQSAKFTLIAVGKPDAASLNRLKRVVQYLIKNNILVSSIDLRAGKKLVVNVGKRP